MSGSYYTVRPMGQQCSLGLGEGDSEEDLNPFFIVFPSIKEAILIRVNDQSLNRNIGKNHLPHKCTRFWLTHNTKLNRTPFKYNISNQQATAILTSLIQVV